MVNNLIGHLVCGYELRVNGLNYGGGGQLNLSGLIIYQPGNPNTNRREEDGVCRALVWRADKDARMNSLWMWVRVPFLPGLCNASGYGGVDWLWLKLMEMVKGEQSTVIDGPTFCIR